MAAFGVGCNHLYRALTGIDLQLYEAARIEGANRFQQAVHVTLPGIAPTVTIMLIMRVGNHDEPGV